MTTVRDEVLMAVGHASVCWMPDGVFDQEQAIKVADMLIEALGLDPDAEAGQLGTKNASARSCHHGYRIYCYERITAGDTTFGRGKQPRQRVRLGVHDLAWYKGKLTQEGFDPIHQHTLDNYHLNWEWGCPPDYYDPINKHGYVTRGENGGDWTDSSRDD